MSLDKASSGTRAVRENTAAKAPAFPKTPRVISGKMVSGCKRRASRSTNLPPPPDDRTLDYAALREGLRGIEPGEVVLAVEQLKGFREVVRPALEAADKARLSPRPGETKRRGRTPSYHALDYWRLELLRRVIASHSTQDTRDWLTTDKAARTRELLGFDKARTHYGGKPKKWMDGIPSDGWMSDFRTKWLPEAELASLMEQLERWALTEKLTTLPNIREECRVLYADGSKLETHATAPILKKDKDGKVIGVLNEWKKGRNGERVPAITAPEAGFLPNDGGNADHSGHGWNIVFVMSSKGTVLAHRNVPIHISEPGTLAEMAPEVGQVLETLGDEPELRVLTTDAAFHSHETRRALRSVGIVENTHLSSHANRESSEKKAKARTKKRYLIDKHPDWFANGHRELVCRCGQGKTSRIASLDPNGRAVARLKGECATCGSVLITSGYGDSPGIESSSNARRASELKPSSTSATRSRSTTRSRRSTGEAASTDKREHSAASFTQRWKLLKNKRWFYRQSQVNLEVSAIVTITHALSLEQWRRTSDVENGPWGGGPSRRIGQRLKLRAAPYKEATLIVL